MSGYRFGQGWMIDQVINLIYCASIFSDISGVMYGPVLADDFDHANFPYYERI